MPIDQSSYAIPRVDLGDAFYEFNPSEDMYITTQVLPILPVPKKSATIPVIRRENQKSVDTKHANGAAYNRINLTTEDMNYTCVNRGIEQQLTDEDRTFYVSDFDAELETVRQIRRSMLLSQEIRAKDLLFNTSTWTGSDLTTDNSGDPWDTVGTDIIGQVQDAKQKVVLNCGYQPDSMLIGLPTFYNMLANTGIKARYPGIDKLDFNTLAAGIAPILGLKNIYIGGATYDSAKEGQDYSGSFIWGDDYALIFKKTEAGLKAPGLGKTLTWSEYGGDNAIMEQYREEQTESDVFRCKHFVQEKVFDAYFAHLLTIDA
jgi:hypothetical protein